MANKYTQSQLYEYFISALDIFNDFIKSDIDQNNVKLLFFTKEDTVQKYEEMCRDFPQYLSEPYKAEDFFTDVAASAFVNGDKYGVLGNL